MKKILFILHLPPPVHGPSVVGETIRSCEQVNGTFSCRYINLSTSDSIADIGRLSLRKLRTMGALTRTVRQTLQEFQPDLVYMTPAACGMGFLKDYLLAREIKKRGFPLVVHFHNKGVAKATGPHWRAMYRDFFRGLKVILLSEALYSDIAGYVSRDQVLFCPNGVEDPGMTVHAETSIPHILFLSNLIVSKGILVLLDACRVLKERGIRYVLDIAGGESAEISAERLEKEVEDRGLSDLVRWHGRVSGMSKEELFRTADIFALPTFNDCFPLVLLEAMAHSLPVVSTEEGAVGDIVSDGATGYLVARKDVAALADSLGKLLNDKSLREGMGTAGRRRFEAYYTREAFLRRFVEILQSL